MCDSSRLLDHFGHNVRELGEKMCLFIVQLNGGFEEKADLCCSFHSVSRLFCFWQVVLQKSVKTAELRR